MIIFYNKKKGNVTGTIDGRVHSEAQLKTWVGDPKEDDRIVVQYIPVKDYKDKKGKIIAQDFEPQTDQKELFIDFDRKKENPLEYKVDLKTKILIKNK